MARPAIRLDQVLGRRIIMPAIILLKKPVTTIVFPRSKARQRAHHPPTPTTRLALVIQHDGKIVVGGDFTQVNNVARNRIARLGLFSFDLQNVCR